MGFRGVAFLKSPFLMHLVQMNTRCDVPSTRIFTFCRFGKNLRLLQRAILEPVPPLDLYWPFLANTFPCSAPFLQITHFLSILRAPLDLLFKFIKYT